MQTRFSSEQLEDPRIQEADAILRRCVHCGFCTATCPTYVELGDERDSPRGRIYLIKEMLEAGRPPDATTVTHVDRCLSCLSCMTTCPSGVDYMHLVDQTRERIASEVRRPWGERLIRAIVANLIPRPRAFRLVLVAGRPFRWLLARLPGRLGRLGQLMPSRVPEPSSADRAHVAPAIAPKRMRVALLPGCAQQVLRPAINEATLRLLQRRGCEVVVLGDVACCGALVHHMGHAEGARQSAQALIAAFERASADERIDALVVTASGCGVQVKDLGHLLADDPDWAVRAAAVAARACDVSEVLTGLATGGERSPSDPATPVVDPEGYAGLRVAYHSACALQHGQKIGGLPVRLLRDAGFDVAEPVDAHLCCGSAGTYNILQPQLAGRLGTRKASTLDRLKPHVVATGNIGCLSQLAPLLDVPVVHTVELLDWAAGGPRPAGIERDFQG